MSRSYKTTNIKMGKNKSLKGTVAFNQASAYYANYPMGEGNPMPINFAFPENFLYGRIDATKNIIYPNVDAIKVIPNNNVSALSFVVDAYEEFRSFMKINRFNKLHDDPVIKGQDWKATKGWKGIESHYAEKIDQILSKFGDGYLKVTKKDEQIYTFEDFVRVFINDFYFNTMQDMPITKSGILQSVHSGPLYTGLCIQIGNIDASGYADKFNNFVNSKNFKVFSWAAAQYGFMLDYHIPFRLVANLNSPALMPFIKNRITQINSSGQSLQDNENSHFHTYSIDDDLNGSTLETTSIATGLATIPDHTHEISAGVVQPAQYQKNQIDNTHDHVLPFIKSEGLTQQDIYDIFFVRAINSEVQEFKALLMNMYNLYLSAYPLNSKPYFCSDNSLDVRASSLFDKSEIRISKTKRKPIQFDMFNKEYNDLFWHKLYFLVRMREVNAPTNEFLIRKALQKIEAQYVLLDSQGALMYINEYLKQYY